MSRVLAATVGEGRKGAVEVGEFEGLLRRNSMVDPTHWSIWYTRHGERAMRRGLLPDNTATLVVRDPARNERDHIDLETEGGVEINLPIPYIPEIGERYTVRKRGPRGTVREFKRIKARGWRAILLQLLGLHFLRPSDEIRSWLGNHDFDKARRSLCPGCY